MAWLSSTKAILAALYVAKVKDTAAGYDLRTLHAECAPVLRGVRRQVSETTMRAVIQWQWRYMQANGADSCRLRALCPRFQIFLYTLLTFPTEHADRPPTR
jgi:hypothetical protein